MDHTLGGGSFFGFGAGCVTPGSDSGFWAGASGAAFAFSAFGVGGGGAIACGGVVDGMLGGCPGVLFCKFRSRGSDASGGRMADLGGGTRGTFTLGMPYQCTVAKASSRVPRSPLGGGADGGIKAAWFLVVRDAANGFDCERSGSVRDRGPPPALLCKRELLPSTS
jgi:hypothetical protein